MILLFGIPLVALTVLAVYRGVTNAKAIPALEGPSMAQLQETETGWTGQTHGFPVRAWMAGRKVELRVQAPLRPPIPLKVNHGPWTGASLDAQWLNLPLGKHPLLMPMQRHHSHSSHLEVYKDEVCLRVGSTGQVEQALGHLGALLEALDRPCLGLREELSAHFTLDPGALTSSVGGLPIGSGHWRGQRMRIEMDRAQIRFTLAHRAPLPSDLRLGKRVQGPHRVGNPVVDLLLSAVTQNPAGLAPLATDGLAQPLLEVLNHFPASTLQGSALTLVIPAPLQEPVLPELEKAWTLVQALNALGEAQPKKG